MLRTMFEQQALVLHTELQDQWKEGLVGTVMQVWRGLASLLCVCHAGETARQRESEVQDHLSTLRICSVQSVLGEQGSTKYCSGEVPSPGQLVHCVCMQWLHELQMKRPHPKFVSPLLSSRSGSKHPRLTPTSTPSSTTHCNPMGGSTPTKQSGQASTQSSTQLSSQPSTHIAAEERLHQEELAKLQQEKKLLESQLSESEDKLRKLKMVKLYRNKVSLQSMIY